MGRCADRFVTVGFGGAAVKAGVMTAVMVDPVTVVATAEVTAATAATAATTESARRCNGRPEQVVWRPQNILDSRCSWRRCSGGWSGGSTGSSECECECE